MRNQDIVVDVDGGIEHFLGNRGVERRPGRPHQRQRRHEHPRDVAPDSRRNGTVGAAFSQHLRILVFRPIPEQMIHSRTVSDGMVHVAFGDQAVGLGAAIQVHGVVGADLGLVEQIGHAVVLVRVQIVVVGPEPVLRLFRHGRVRQREHRRGVAHGLSVLPVVAAIVPSTLELPGVPQGRTVLGVAILVEPAVGGAATLRPEELERCFEDVVVDVLADREGLRRVGPHGDPVASFRPERAERRLPQVFGLGGSLAVAEVVTREDRSVVPADEHPRLERIESPHGLQLPRIGHEAGCVQDPEFVRLGSRGIAAHEGHLAQVLRQVAHLVHPDRIHEVVVERIQLPTTAGSAFVGLRVRAGDGGQDGQDQDAHGALQFISQIV